MIAPMELYKWDQVTDYQIGMHKDNDTITSSIDTSKARTILCFDASMTSIIWFSIQEEWEYIGVLDVSNHGQ